MNHPLDGAARALYERNCPIAPDWDQLGEITKSVWREDVVKRGYAPAAAAPAADVPASASVSEQTPPEDRADQFDLFGGAAASAPAERPRG